MMMRRPACVRQQTSADCGAACLATIALHFGKPVSIGTARLCTSTDQTGTSALGLVQGARSLGMKARVLRVDSEFVDEIPLPAIAHVIREGFCHYVVIHRVTASRIVIADPARGICRVDRRRFLGLWTGVVIVCEPPACIEGKSKLPGGCRRLAQLMRPFSLFLIEILIAAFFLTLLSFCFALYLQITIDNLVKSRLFETPIWLSLALLGVVICRFAFSLMRGLLMAHIARKMDLKLISGFYHHLIRLPAIFFQGVRVGDIISRLVDAAKMREMAGGSTLVTTLDSACLLAGFAVLSFYSWKLALFTAGLMLPLALILVLFNRPLRKYQRQALDFAGRLQSHFVEGFSGISTIRAFNAETAAADRMQHALIPFANSLFMTSVIALLAGGLGEFIAGVGLTAVLWLAGTLVSAGRLTVGEMISCYSILFLMLQPLLRLLQLNYAIQDSLVSANRLGELMDLPVEEKKACLAPPEDGPGEICFKQVSFRYGARARVLHGIDLVIPSRGVTALVGESGSGKSTLIRLLLREFDPEEGVIEYAGQNLQGIDPQGLRSQIGYVPQDPFFFSGTIRENLCLGKAGFSQQDLQDAMRAASLNEFLDSLPCQLDTHIGEGGLILSGGQRQRLAIARMLLHRPRVALLDEPTSNVDALTEQGLLKTISNLAKEIPMLVVAHRLSTIRFANRIAVIDKGKIVEFGTHAELMARLGLYCALWKTQLGMEWPSTRQSHFGSEENQKSHRRDAESATYLSS
jgi:ATP-binding cassette, subfamily C, bacteriocin exporter